MKSRLKPTILILGSEDDLNLINLIEWLNFHRVNLFFMNTSIMEIDNVKMWDRKVCQVVLWINRELAQFDELINQE